jgi:hypothetical protein
MGFDFTVTASGSSSLTVASGQTASYTLVLTPLNGSQGTFAFQCASLPTNAACAFSPATEALDAGVTGNVTLRISTGNAVSSANRIGLGAWSALSLLCALVLVPLGWRRHRRALFLAALLAFIVATVSSCTSSGGGTGGGSGGGSGSGSTSAGTYSIPVTVSSTGVQHSLTLTLVVD